jgi:hypothetical protein
MSPTRRKCGTDRSTTEVGARMSFDVAGFGWHATIFVGRWLLLFAGSAVVVVAGIILKIFFGARRDVN